MNITARIAAAAIAVSSAGIYAASIARPAANPPIQVEIPPIAAEDLLFDVLTPPLDMYGNEVTTAIARYKLDASGVLYEEHSPDTELPRLGIPRS